MVEAPKGKQEFTLLEDGKVKYTYEAPFVEMIPKDQEESVGLKRYFNENIFNSKADALAVLNTDLDEGAKAVEFYKKKMDANDHDINKFKELQTLLEKVSELNTTVSKLNETPKQLYEEHPKKYQKLWKEFSQARQLITAEIGAIANDYDKMQKYVVDKKAYDFNVAQIEKIKEQAAQVEVL